MDNVYILTVGGSLHEYFVQKRDERFTPENRNVGSIADGMAPSSPTAALRLCLQQSGTQTGLSDGSARLPATVTTNSPEAHHLQRVADKVCLGTLKPYAGTRRHSAD